MKYAFFGTPEFAAIILEKLISAGFPPQIVICNPDKPTGRKKVITPPPAKLIAQKHNVKILQPQKLSPSGRCPYGTSPFGTEIKNIDFAVVAAYSQKIPKEILNLFKLGVIGIHPSLLPKYRGPSPIQTAILNGDSETGVTLYLLDEKIDHGGMLAKTEIRISESETYSALLEKLAREGADLLIESLPAFTEGKIKPKLQDHSLATYTKKFTSRDGYVDLGKDDPVLIERKVRALNPEPGVWTIKDGKRMKILEVKISDGKLKLKKTQFAGKKPIML